MPSSGIPASYIASSMSSAGLNEIAREANALSAYSQQRLLECLVNHFKAGFGQLTVITVPWICGKYVIVRFNRFTFQPEIYRRSLRTSESTGLR